ncbi:hypothetical protein VNI00_013376 [Paramarasmius palmivorus]|uniref:Uncharacterized protein n=1 Tax=Paramarasmius palmivorus TaxID=297713 RepID=A0AAW0BZE7_9AGAR
MTSPPTRREYGGIQERLFYLCYRDSLHEEQTERINNFETALNGFDAIPEHTYPLTQPEDDLEGRIQQDAASGVVGPGGESKGDIMEKVHNQTKRPAPHGQVDALPSATFNFKDIDRSPPGQISSTIPFPSLPDTKEYLYDRHVPDIPSSDRLEYSATVLTPASAMHGTNSKPYQNASEVSVKSTYTSLNTSIGAFDPLPEPEQEQELDSQPEGNAEILVKIQPCEDLFSKCGQQDGTNPQCPADSGGLNRHSVGLQASSLTCTEQSIAALAPASSTTLNRHGQHPYLRRISSNLANARLTAVSIQRPSSAPPDVSTLDVSCFTRYIIYLGRDPETHLMIHGIYCHWFGYGGAQRLVTQSGKEPVIWRAFTNTTIAHEFHSELERNRIFHLLRKPADETTYFIVIEGVNPGVYQNKLDFISTGLRWRGGRVERHVGDYQSAMDAFRMYRQRREVHTWLDTPDKDM